MIVQLAMLAAALTLRGTPAPSSINPLLQAQLVSMRPGANPIKSPYSLRFALTNTSDDVTDVRTCASDLKIDHYRIGWSTPDNLGSESAFAIGGPETSGRSSGCQVIVLAPGETRSVDFYFYNGGFIRTNANRMTLVTSQGQFVFVSNAKLAAQ